MKPKKLLLVIGGIVLLMIVICVGGSMLTNGAAQQMGGTPTPATTPEIAVRARGSVVPARWSNLAFDANGPIVEWLVAEGDSVAAGAPLARLDAAKLELALQQARLELESAQVHLSEAEKTQASQLAEAELALQTAEVRRKQAGMRVPQVTSAEVRLQSAISDEARARDEYNKSLDRPWEESSVREEYQRMLEQTISARRIAQTEYDAARSQRAADSQELAILADEVARAQLALEKARRGVDPTLAQDIERATLRVTQAQADLDAATLVAPFAGTVVKLHLRTGDWVQLGVAALTLADLTTLQIETDDLDEWGASHIQAGDVARITFTAFDDKTLPGHVTEIALRGEKPGSDVVYRTIIALDQPDPELRWGMSVRITIPLEE